MTPTIITFEPPDDVITMNKRLHWTVRSRLTRIWRDTTGWAAIAALNVSPEARAQPRSAVRVTFPVAGNRRRDPHNWAPTVKAIVDGLVDVGLWPDDTPEWVEPLNPFLDQHATLVEVRITPIAGGAGL